MIEIQRLRVAFVCLALLGGFSTLPAQEEPPAKDLAPTRPGFVDKKLGEEEEIRLRNEWFYSTRRAGTSSDQELWQRRLAAVQETRSAIAAQQARQALGLESEQNVWVSKGPSPSEFGGWAFGTVSGRIMALAADWDNDILYAGAASGGVWKSTNDGLSWTNIFDTAGTQAIGAIEIDPNDSNVLWVGTGDNVVGCEGYFGIGLLRSPDGGETWEPRNGSGESALDLSTFGAISIDPRDSNKLVVGGRIRGCVDGNQASGGIYVTEDGGMTWEVRLPTTEIYEILRDPGNPDILWAGTDSGVQKSFNNGVNWAPQTASGIPNGSLGRMEIAMAPNDPNTVYALFDQPGDQFWRTSNGGTTWELMTPDACDGQCWYNMTIRVDPYDRDTVYRGTIRLFKTTTAGTTWVPLTNGWGASQQVHQDTHVLLVHPTIEGKFYVGSDGGLWKSEDGGSSFSNLNGNMNVTQFYGIGVDANDPERICGGAQDNSSLARDGNDVWELQAVTGDGFLCYIDPVDPDTAFITSYPSGGYPNIWRSKNGLFGDFDDISGAGSGIIANDRISWVTPYIQDQTNPNVLYIGTHRVYQSHDGGDSWTHVGPADLSGDGVSSLSVVEINRGFPAVVYSGSYGGAVWRTANGGADWTNITTGLPPRAVNDIAGDPTNPDRAFAVVGGFNTGHLWEWNLESGWTERGAGLPNVPANSVLMLSDNDILVGVDTGIFRSVDGGQNFIPFMVGLPEGLVVVDLKYNERQSVVTAGTYARGAWQVSVGPLQPILFAEEVVLPLTEDDGDGDDKVEPGETWSVHPILRNAGGVTALAVNARLASQTEGITVLQPDSSSFGDIDPAVAAPSLTPYRFTVDPGLDCGTEVLFDLVEITSETEPGAYPDRPEFYSLNVQGGNEPPDVSTLLDADADTVPPWPHEMVDPGLPGCALVAYIDEWSVASKDAGHGQSFHAGNGAGGSYSTVNAAWLHPAGKDSEDGAGIDIPSEAIAATLTLVHWYETEAGQDGGQVVADVTEDNLDLYTTLKPLGDYPGTLGTGLCNPLEGQGAFQGSSGGWVVSQFDLTPYVGKRIYPAFVFGSDRLEESGEGWYVDQLLIEYQTIGAPTCDIARWPGEVASAQFHLVGPGTIEATWNDSCNVPDFPEQTYSIQVGDLDGLASSGTYSHAPLDDLCDQPSGTTFAAGAGNEYYLIVPVGEGREGGAGTASNGSARPQSVAVCGETRVSCP